MRSNTIRFEQSQQCALMAHVPVVAYFKLECCCLIMMLFTGFVMRTAGHRVHSRTPEGKKKTSYVEWVDPANVRGRAWRTNGCTCYCLCGLTATLACHCCLPQIVLEQAAATRLLYSDIGSFVAYLLDFMHTVTTKIAFHHPLRPRWLR